MPDPVILKKYANRRLYDTAQSAYVTLDQVAAMIKDGNTVKIIDEKSKEDVTGFVLMQILMEESKKNAMWPVSLLHLIIQDSDLILSEFFGRYLEQTIAVYLSSKKAFDAYFRQWLDMGMNMTEMKNNPFMNVGHFTNFFNVAGANSPLDESEKKETKK